MASRKDLKAQRRQERLEREQAEERAGQRRRRLQYAFGGVLALALVAGLGVAITVLAGGVDALARAGVAKSRLRQCKSRHKRGAFVA